MSPETPSSQPTDHDDVERFNEGMALLKTGRIDEAIEHFRVAATSGKDRPMEHYALGAALYKNKQFTEAREEFERFLAMSPEDNRYVRQARAALPVIDKALSQRATEEDADGGGEPDPSPETDLLHNAAYGDAINAYLRGDYEEARDHFLKAYRDLPGNLHVHNNLGLTYLAMQEFGKAIEQFETCLDMTPDFHEARTNLGIAWNDYGVHRARQAFETVLEADPECFDALVHLGTLEYRQGNLAESRALWERAQALKPDDPQVRRNIEGLG